MAGYEATEVLGGKRCIYKLKVDNVWLWCLVHIPNSPFNGPAVVQLDQSNNKKVDNSLIEEDCGKKPYTLAR